MRLHRLAGPEPFQPDDSPVHLMQEGGRRLVGGVPRAGDHKRRLGLPPGALLGAEQPVGGLRPVERHLRAPGGQRAVGRHEQQFGSFRHPAADLFEVSNRCVRLGERVAEQPGREQHRAAVGAQGRQRHAERPEPRGRLVEKCEGGGKVPGPERDERPVQHRVDRFELLTGLREQSPGGHEIGVCPVGEPERHVDKAPDVQRPGRPQRVARAAEHGHGAAQVLKCRRITADRPQRATAQEAHPRRWHAARSLDRSFEGGQPVRRAARVDERHSQAGQYVGLAVGGTASPRVLKRAAHFAYRRRDIAEVTHDDPGGLMGNRGLIGPWTRGQHRACSR